uniref:CUB domain-containing protein n=1 Tax=Panagrolaimus sp. ES5 TaxID=591445 RepID=A0AC34GI93_9BILA
GDNDSTLLIRLRGTISSDQWFTTHYSNRMLVRFVSTAGFSNVSGWVLFFKARATSAPSTTITPPTTTTTQPDNTYYGSGTITSPGYPSLYPKNLNATYILQATPGKIVRITFNRINTERCCDTITIYDGAFEDERKVITT